MLLGCHSIPVKADPVVSILLVTKRPDYLEHAVAQIRAQRYGSKELVAVLHGDDFDLEAFAELTASCDFPTTTIQQPSTATFGDCLKILQRYGLESQLPETIRRRLSMGAKGEIEETPKTDDFDWDRVQNVIIGNNRMALEAASRKAQDLGFNPFILTSQLQGEAREAAHVVAAIGKEIAQHQTPLIPPACILLGGETTVTLKGDGEGGRNQEISLAAALALDGIQKIYLLSAGSDGSDGPTDAAGAFTDGETCDRARKLGLDPHDFLARNDAYTFFKPLDDLYITGPTRTNVMDIIIVLVET